MLTIKQAARLMNLTEQTIRCLCQVGELGTSFKNGETGRRTYIVYEDKVMQRIEAKKEYEKWRKKND